MITFLITSFKEPTTIGRAIKAFTTQGISNYELLVVAPDEPTLDVARKYASKNKRIKVVKDPGRGKPSALNLVFKKAKGEIIILSDGDVQIGKNSVKSLLKAFDDKKVGAASGQVFSTNDKDTMFGYWASLLTKGYHQQRKRENDQTVCSGYLYAIRNGIIKEIPVDTLADDAYISYKILEDGYKSMYVPNAGVFVKYPDNLSDWIRQKKRTAGRLYQLKERFKLKRGNVFKGELLIGLKTLLSQHTLKHLVWFTFLAVMRLYIWIRVFFDFRLRRMEFGKVWQRVESTK